MLDLLATLDEILNTTVCIDETTKKETLFAFSHFKSKDWIYPGAIKRNLHLSIEDVYRVLEALRREGATESWYEYHCGHCQRPLGAVQQFNELPEYIECDYCEEEFPTVENTIKIYRVL